MRRSVKVLLKILLGIFIFLVLVIAGLFVYAKFFYDERDSSYMSFSSFIMAGKSFGTHNLT